MTLYMGLASIKSKYFEEFPDKLFADSIETTTFVTSKSIISQIFKTISHENKCN